MLTQTRSFAPAATLPRFVLQLVAASGVAAAAANPARAQSAAQGAAQGSAQGAAPSTASLALPEITALVKVEVGISKLRDSVNLQLAMQRNKTREMQEALRELLAKRTGEVIKAGGLTEQEYSRRTFVIATNNAARTSYDSIVIALTGSPLAGAPVPVAAAAVPTMPPGPAGVHIGHVVLAFGDTPMGRGLLPTAIAEANTAAQHAQLAGRQPTNLDYMKTHAAHVLHALDPSLVPMGPGLGYGVKKAAAAVAAHIELAAGAQGATPNIVTHSAHIATSARNTVARADQLIALAQKVQASNSAAEAASLVNQMASLASQLVAGADANNDGRITWEQHEGGLQQADDHVKLMLAAAGGR